MNEIEQLENELLVLRSQRGDAPAFDSLVRAWQAPLARLLYPLVGNTEVVKDISQEVWMAVIRCIGRLEDPSRFRPWLYRIATRRAVDWMRREERKRRSMQDLVNEPTPTGLMPCEDAERVWRAVRRLPEHQRVAVVLVYGQGCTVDEAAATLGCPAGTVKSRLARARDTLRNILNCDPGEESGGHG